MIRRIGPAEELLANIFNKRAELHEQKMDLLTRINEEVSFEELNALKSKILPMIKTEFCDLLIFYLDRSSHITDSVKKSMYLSTLAQLHRESLNLSKDSKFSLIGLDNEHSFHAKLIDIFNSLEIKLKKYSSFFL